MHKDLITYELAQNVTEDHLLKVANRIINEWMKHLPGFISWEICKSSNGSYTDIVCWENEATAKAAEPKMREIPNGHEWFACYKPDTIQGNTLSVVFKS